VTDLVGAIADRRSAGVGSSGAGSFLATASSLRVGRARLASAETSGDVAIGLTFLPAFF
jgi:hypothetical protein